MFLEIKSHTVPHLKALTRSIECWGRHRHGSTFKQHYTVLKSAVLLHKRAKRRFHVMVAVYPAVIGFSKCRLCNSLIRKMSWCSAIFVVPMQYKRLRHCKKKISDLIASEDERETRETKKSRLVFRFVWNVMYVI